MDDTNDGTGTVGEPPVQARNSALDLTDSSKE
jgi:hypothetical protein